MTVLAKSIFTGTSGNTATTANTGFDAVTVDTNHLLVTSTNARAAGLCLGIAPVSAAVFGTWTTTIGTQTTWSGRCTVIVGGTMASSKQFFRASNGASQCFALAFSSSTPNPRLVIRDAANAAILTDASSQFTIGTRIGIAWTVTHNGTSGTIQYWIYNDDTYAAGSLQRNNTVTFTASGNGTQATNYDFGMKDTSGPTYQMDDVAVATVIGDLAPFAQGSTSPVGWQQGNTFGVAPLIGQAVNWAQGNTLAVSTSTNVNQSVAFTQGNTMGVAGAIARTATVLWQQGSIFGVVPSTAYSRWLALPQGNRLIDHRGCEYDYPEMTMSAYASCTTLDPTSAINVDGWLSSDGVLIASHDQNTLRVTGVSMDIPTSTAASILALTTLTGGQPLCRVKDVLDAYAATKLIYIENKQGGAAQSAFNTLLASYPTCLTNFVWKTYYTGTTGFTSAKSAGAVQYGWGYRNLGDGPWTTGDAAPWDQLGLAYNETSANWTTSLGVGAAQGKLVIAHVITSAADAATAWSVGAQGLMTGKQLGVAPDAAPAFLQGNTFSVAGLVAFTAAVSFQQGNTFAVSPQTARTSSVAWLQANTMSVTAAIARTSTVAWQQANTFTVTGQLGAPVLWAQGNTLGIQASGLAQSAVNFAQGNTFAVAGQISTSASVAFSQANTFGVAGQIARQTAVAFTQGNTMAIAGSGSISSPVLWQQGNTLAVTARVDSVAAVRWQQGNTLAISNQIPIPPVTVLSVSGPAQPPYTVLTPTAPPWSWT